MAINTQHIVIAQYVNIIATQFWSGSTIVRNTPSACMRVCGAAFQAASAFNEER